jgi:hypothetical protein
MMSKLFTPPHANATTSAEFENASDNFDNASTVLDEWFARFLPRCYNC